MSKESDQIGAEESSNAIFVEAFSSFAMVFAAILFFAIISIWVGVIAELLYALVAIVFFVVPQKVMDRRGLDPEDYGMTMERPLRNVGWGLVATAVTLPLFVGGYWFWETQIRERELNFETSRYLQWAVDLQGEPDAWGEESAGVWIWAEDHVLKVGLRNRDVANNEVIVQTDRAVRPKLRGVVAEDLGDGRTWVLTLPSSRGKGVATFEGATGVDIEVSPVVEGRERWPVHTGPAAELTEGEPLHLDRDLWWLALWLATQVLLIALPEEYYYRGYLQTRLGEAFARRRAERGREPSRFEFLGINVEVVLASFLFGIGHLLIPVGGVLLTNRFAVFFPALLFGALRRKTGTITAPVVYHAACNMMVLVAAVHFD